MTKFRSLLEIRKAALSSSLKRRAQEYFARADHYEGLRSRLKFQSDRLQAVLDFYEVAKLSDVPRVDREIAEGVAGGSRDALIRFSEVHIGQKIDSLNPDRLVTEFNESFRRELEKEIQLILDYLKPCYEAWGVEAELTTDNPTLRALKMYHERSGPCAAGGGVHAVDSTFRGLLD
jgi:hypothetical protein